MRQLRARFEVGERDHVRYGVHLLKPEGVTEPTGFGGRRRHVNAGHGAHGGAGKDAGDGARDGILGK